LSERADIGTFEGADTWIGGYVIIRSRIAGEWYISALDPLTGDLEWQTKHPTSGSIQVLSDEYFKVNAGTIIGYGFFGAPIYDPASVVWMCYNIDDGTFAFNSTAGVPPSGYDVIRDENIIVRTVLLGSGLDSDFRFVAYDISNVQQGVPVAWNISTIWGGGSGFQAEPSFLCYGDGLLFYGSWSDYYVKAVNATDGTVAWTSWTKCRLRDGMYYDGKLITSGIGTIMTAYDKDDGTVLWEYDAGVRGFFANTGCAAYGMIYQHCMDIPYGYFGAWDADTGELVWKLPAWYFIGYFSPCVADGKVYSVMSDGRGVGASLDVPPDYTACIDAFLVK
jgi:outer membrane protein assembly factor BamB